MSKAIKLTKDPIWELLRKVTIPASVGSLFQTFYNLVDTWFAGRISAEAIGAIAKSFPIYFVIIAVGVGIGAATNSCIGNLLGAKKINKASLFIAQSVIFSLVTSIIVTLFGLNASNFLLSVMGSDAAGIALTREYLDIIFYGTFIVMIQISLNGALNAQGDTKSYRNVIKNLEQCAQFHSGSKLLENQRNLSNEDIPPILPKFFKEDGGWRGLLPGDKGYEDH